jgi:hypothetical protein
VPIILLIFSLLTLSFADKDFKLRGSSSPMETRLMIQYYQWPSNLDGFVLKKKAVNANRWREVKQRLIQPQAIKTAKLNGQLLDTNFAQKYAKDYKNTLNEIRNETSSKEIIEQLKAASKRQIKGDFSRFKRNFYKAMAIGIAFVDKACPVGAQYGLFGVFNGKEQQKPLDIFTCVDQSKWSWKDMGQTFRVHSNRIDINTTIRRKWYLDRELINQKVYLAAKGEKKLIGDMHPLAHTAEFSAYIMKDTNQIFTKDMEYTFEFYNNLGHLVYTKKLVKDLRQDLRSKIREGKITYFAREGHSLKFDYHRPFYADDTLYVKKVEALLIDTLQKDTIFRQQINMDPYFSNHTKQYRIKLSDVSLPLIPAELKLEMLTTSKNDQFLRTKPEYFQFYPITPIVLDTFYFTNDSVYLKVLGTADSYTMQTYRGKMQNSKVDKNGFFRTSIRGNSKNQFINLWGFKKNIPSTDTLRFTFKVPDVGDPKGLFQSKVFGNNHFIKLRHLQGEIFKKALFKHLEFRQYLGDSLIATRQSQGNPGDKEFAVVFDNIQDTLTYQYSAVIRYDHNYYQETQPSRRHKLKSKHKFLQAKDSEIISWEWRDENYGAPSLLILPKINETFPGGDDNAMIAVNANGKILETFKSIQYVPDVGFKFQPYHRSYDGDSVKVSFYFKNTDEVWLDPGVTRQVLMRFRKGIPTGYKLKSQDGVLSWKTLERDAMQGKWEIFHRGEKVATTSTKSWTIPDKYNKPGSIFQVQAITTFGGVSPLSKPFVLGE